MARRRKEGRQLQEVQERLQNINLNDEDQQAEERARRSDRADPPSVDLERRCWRWALRRDGDDLDNDPYQGPPGGGGNPYDGGRSGGH